MNYSFVVVRPERFIVLRTTRTNKKRLDSVGCSSRGTHARGRDRASVSERTWAYQTKSAFSDAAYIAPEPPACNRRYSIRCRPVSGADARATKNAAPRPRFSVLTGHRLSAGGYSHGPAWCRPCRYPTSGSSGSGHCRDRCGQRLPAGVRSRPCSGRRHGGIRCLPGTCA